MRVFFTGNPNSYEHTPKNIGVCKAQGKCMSKMKVGAIQAFVLQSVFWGAG